MSASRKASLNDATWPRCTAVGNADGVGGVGMGATSTSRPAEFAIPPRSTRNATCRLQALRRPHRQQLPGLVGVSQVVDGVPLLRDGRRGRRARGVQPPPVPGRVPCGLRDHTLGYRQHRADHTAVVAFSDHLERLVPIEIGVGTMQPEAGGLVPKHLTKQIDY